MENTANFSTEELAAIFGDDKLLNIEKSSTYKGVSTDSRTIQRGNIFVALKGESFDANEKVQDAFEKGAAIALVNKDFPEKFPDLFANKPLIIVGDTLEALGRLASYHRCRFNIPVVAIGGSNGKTTTKNITAHLLSQKYRVLSTYGNFNNRVGVPLMMLQITDNTEIAVLEIGTNEPGEISILAEMLKPTHGLITNIGREHLEKLGSIRGVELEETFLYGYLHKTSGLSFVNIDDSILKKYLKIIENAYTFGNSADADLFASAEFDDDLRPRILFKTNNAEFYVSTNTNGFSTALNAIAATSIALHFKVSPEDIKIGLETYKQDTSKGYGRMTIEKQDNFKIINDCYNSNPDSLAYALKSLLSIRCEGKRVAVIADMLELGESSASEHKKALENAINSADILFLYGPEMKKAFLEFADIDRIKHFYDKNDLINELSNTISIGDVVLVKGSRGMRMEEVVAFMKELSL